MYCVYNSYVRFYVESWSKNPLNKRSPGSDLQKWIKKSHDLPTKRAARTQIPTYKFRSTKGTAAMRSKVRQRVKVQSTCWNTMDLLGNSPVENEKPCSLMIFNDFNLSCWNHLKAFILNKSRFVCLWSKLWPKKPKIGQQKEIWISQPLLDIEKKSERNHQISVPALHVQRCGKGQSWIITSKAGLLPEKNRVVKCQQKNTQKNCKKNRINQNCLF